MKTETIDVWIPIFANSECPIKTLKELDKAYFYTKHINDYPHKYKLKAKLVIEVPETNLSDMVVRLKEIITNNIGEGPGGICGVEDAVAEILSLITESK